MVAIGGGCFAAAAPAGAGRKTAPVTGRAYGVAAATGKGQKVAPIGGRVHVAAAPAGYGHRASRVRGTGFAAGHGWHLGREKRAVRGRVFAAATGYGSLQRSTPFLRTVNRIEALRAWLQVQLTDAGVTVWVDEPPPGGPAPFVVLTGQLIPERFALSGAWELGSFEVTWWAVHDSRLQARAVGDLVQAAFLSPAARTVLEGTLDVEPDRGSAEDLVGGVPQVRSGAVFALTRT